MNKKLFLNMKVYGAWVALLIGHAVAGTSVNDFITYSAADGAQAPHTHTEQGVYSAAPKLIKLLSMLGVMVTNQSSCNADQIVMTLDNSLLETIERVVQGRWDREYSWYQPRERWVMNTETAPWHKKLFDSHPERRERVLSFVLTDTEDGLNMAHERAPECESYDYVLLLGSSTQDFKTRVIYFKQLIDNKQLDVSQSTVCILTGERPLQPHEFAVLKELAPTLEKQPTSEKEAMVLIFKAIVGNDCQVIVDNDTFPRATTDSTVRKFFSTYRVEDTQSVLLVSSHTFSLYQQLVFERNAIVSGFKGLIDCCAPSLDLYNALLQSLTPSQRLAIALDNIAKIIYEIKRIKQPRPATFWPFSSCCMS